MSDPAAPTLSVTRTADGALLLTVGGAWSLREPAPAFQDLASEFEKDPAPGEVRFDMTQLGSCDSSLTSILVELAKTCQDKGIKLDTSGFTEGIRQLVNMALAVPEKKTHQGPTRELFFTRLGEAGLTLGAGVMEVFVFVGLCVISFGRISAKTYDRTTRFRREDPELAERFLDIPYEELTADPLPAVEKIHEQFHLPLAREARAAMRTYLETHPKGRHGRHRYRLEDYGLDEKHVKERFAGQYGMPAAEAIRAA